MVLVVVVAVVAVYLSICLPASLKTKLFCETSSIFKFGQFLNLITLKTMQFLRDFFFLEADNIKNERMLRDVFQKWRIECRADGLVLMRFAIFPVHLSKILRLPRKSDARLYEVLRL